jgi:hypothetical protein
LYEGVVNMIADKAIDGKIEGIHDCVHTSSGFSYWAVKFGTSGPVKSVKSVKMKLRTDYCCMISIFILLQGNEFKITSLIFHNRHQTSEDIFREFGNIIL